MQTPEIISEHAKNYLPDAWKEYTPQELGQWIHLLLKRAKHRSDKAKAQKDVDDARNYLAMLVEHVKEANNSIS